MADTGDRLARALDAAGQTFLHRSFLAAAALVVAAAVWIPCLHFLYAPGAADLKRDGRASPMARALAARQLALWTDDQLRTVEINRMRATCQEWDFMGRTFLVLALSNMALRDAGDADRCLEAVDAIIDETVTLEKERGFTFFLMDYGKEDSHFRQKPARSIFVDGEIALMMGARRLVREKAAYREPMLERLASMQSRMSQNPVLCAESYPDECWMFCNAVALAAMRMSDVLDGTDHSAFFGRWVETARSRLVEPRTCLLVSSFALDGHVCDGPEGSSIWMAAHCLRLVDEGFAREQYERARRLLGGGMLGFGWSREWPEGLVGSRDVDSGAVVPGIGASPSASGLAILCSASFGDDAFRRRLLTSLNFAGYPSRRGGALRFCAGNQVGDAVVLYSAVLGPLWDKALGAKGAAQ